MLITSLCELHSKSEIRFDVVNIKLLEYNISDLRAHTHTIHCDGIIL